MHSHSRSSGKDRPNLVPSFDSAISFLFVSRRPPSFSRTGLPSSTGMRRQYTLMGHAIISPRPFNRVHLVSLLTALRHKPDRNNKAGADNQSAWTCARSIEDCTEAVCFDCSAGHRIQCPSGRLQRPSGAAPPQQPSAPSPARLPSGQSQRPVGRFPGRTTSRQSQGGGLLPEQPDLGPCTWLHPPLRRSDSLWEDASDRGTEWGGSR